MDALMELDDISELAEIMDSDVMKLDFLLFVIKDDDVLMVELPDESTTASAKRSPKHDRGRWQAGEAGAAQSRVLLLEHDGGDGERSVWFEAAMLEKKHVKDKGKQQGEAVARFPHNDERRPIAVMAAARARCHLDAIWLRFGYVARRGAARFADDAHKLMRMLLPLRALKK